jgi:WD40 repeat protein
MENTVRIFVSSPGDVAEERALTERVIARLAEEWSHSLSISSFLWEHEPLRATATYQDEIGRLCRPSEADVVVCLLWCRFGSRLPASITRPDGTTYSSGTEYELEDAAAGYDRTGVRPALLVYKKTARLLVDIDDPFYAERRWQKDELDAFLSAWSQNADGTAKRSVHYFQNPSEFEVLIERHLDKLLSGTLADVERKRRSRASWRESPFRGLAVFEPHHSSIFFGRTTATSAVVKAVRDRDARGEGLVAVIGASGSGKSSLVRAGVLSLLTTPGVMPGVGLWRQAVVVPGERDADPFRGLAAAVTDGGALPELAANGTTVDELAARFHEHPAGFGLVVEGGLRQAAAQAQRDGGLDASPEPRLALLVDQMEQLFTLEGVTADDRAAFVGCLASAVRSRAAVVLLTVRRDFAERCHEIPELLALMQGDGQYQLQSPGPAELERIITRPAALAGLDFDPGSEDRLPLDQRLRDAALAHPHSLPLLEFALDQLYERRTPEGRLTHTAYDAMGGLEGAVSSHAERAFLTWRGPASGPAAEAAAEAALGALLQSLVSVQPDTEQVTASRLAEDGIRSARARDLAGALVAARLLVRDTDQAGRPLLAVAHEALFREWPRARRWLDRNLEFLRVRARIEGDRKRWEASSPEPDRRDPGFLIPAEGRRLAEAEDLVRKHGDDLDVATRGFIKASARKAAARATRRRSGYAALLVLLLGTAFGIYAVVQSRQVARERGLAIAYRLAAQAELTRAQRPGLSALLAAESLVRYPGVEGDVALRRSLALLPELASEQEVGTIQAVSVPPGAFVVESDRQRGLRVFDPISGVRSQWLLAGLADELTLSNTHVTPDGSRIVNLTHSFGRKNRLRVVEVGTAKVTPVDVDGYFERTALSPDGRWLAGVGRSKVRTWDLAVSPPRAHDASAVREDHPGLLGFSPDSRRLAVRLGFDVAVFDSALGTTLTLQRSTSVNSIAFRPHTDEIAVAGEKNVCFWRLSPRSRPSCIPQDQTVEHVAFDASGKRLAVAGSSGVVRIIDARTRAQTARLAHERKVASVVWNAAGTQLVSTTTDHNKPDDKILHVWNIEGEREIARLSDEARVLRFDTELVTVSNAGRIRRWALHSGLNEDRLLPHPQAVHDVTFAPDRKSVITGTGYDGDDDTDTPDFNVRIWSLEAVAPPTVVPQGQAVGFVRVVHEGRYLLAAGRWGIGVWDLKERRLAPGVPCQIDAEDVAYVGLGFALSDDGRRVGCPTVSGGIQVFSVADGEPLGPPSPTQQEGARLALNRDGSVLAIAGENALEIRDVATGRELGRAKLEGAGLPSFIPSSDRLAVISESGLRFFDLTRRDWDALRIDVPVTLPPTIDPQGRLVLLLREAVASIRDLESGAEIARFVHTSELRDAALSPDGRLLATATADDVAHVWDVAERRERVRLAVVSDSGADSLHRVVFSLDGKLLATKHRWDVRVWRLDLDDLRTTTCARVKGNLTAAEWEDYVGAGEPCRATCPDYPACMATPAEGESRSRLQK